MSIIRVKLTNTKNYTHAYCTGKGRASKKIRTKNNFHLSNLMGSSLDREKQKRQENAHLTCESKSNLVVARAVIGR